MKYLKRYQLFESSKFANHLDVKDILIDLVDDNIISNCDFIDSGYFYFTGININRKIQSELYYDMESFPENWEFRKPDELLGQTWKELFLDVESEGINKNTLSRNIEYVYLDDVNNSSSRVRLSGITNKTFDELFLENIESGKIPAYQIMLFTLGSFDKSNLPEIVDSLKRVYQATGFRPLKGFWLEDYVDEETGYVVTLGRGEVEFVKCSDKSYQVLRSALAENDITKVITHHFL
jgi:hypothetical protein